CLSTLMPAKRFESAPGTFRTPAESRKAVSFGSLSRLIQRAISTSAVCQKRSSLQHGLAARRNARKLIHFRGYVDADLRPVHRRAAGSGGGGRFGRRPRVTPMAISIKPLHPLFGAEIGQVDIGRPLDDAMFAEIRAAFEEYSLLLFRDQELDDNKQVQFSE